MEQALSRRRTYLRAHNITWKQITLWVVLALAILLIGARLYLPVWLKDYVNDHLNAMKGYRGHVEDIDVHLYRGAYTIKGLILNKIDKGIPAPFLDFAATDISLQWGALLHGRIVSDITLTRPVINFATSKSGATAQTGTETNWNPLIDALVPIDINFIEINDGKVAYKDFSAEKKVDLFIHHVNGRLTNLKNVEDKGVALPSDIHITGQSIGNGKLSIDGKLNTLSKTLDMDVDTKLERAQFKAFNAFSDECCALTFKGGTVDVYSEMAVKNDQVNGYVKLLVRDLSVERTNEDKNVLEVLWANIAAVLIEIFTNQPKDQFAAKVPVTGNLNQPATAIWPTLGSIFRNAFIQAFERGTDNEISFGGTKIKRAAASEPKEEEEAETTTPKFPGAESDHPHKN